MPVLKKPAGILKRPAYQINASGYYSGLYNPDTRPSRSKAALSARVAAAAAAAAEAAPVQAAADTAAAAAAAAAATAATAAGPLLNVQEFKTPGKNRCNVMIVRTVRPS